MAQLVAHWSKDQGRWFKSNHPDKIMNILLTNDDGYRAEGIKILGKHISKFGNVTIVAPENNQSTTSHSISLGKPLRCKKISNNIYSISGLPADCVNFAINSKKINKKFDIVISGINDGANVGDDINYSGTVGAAREGYLHGINSIAVSIVIKKILSLNRLQIYFLKYSVK